MITTSVIVPFHDNLQNLRRCLDALNTAGRALPPGAAPCEVIVVADGATADPDLVARETGAVLLTIDGPRGPAVARNRGAACATGTLLVFVDSDVLVHHDALVRFMRVFATQTVDAAFGAYDESPDDPGFVSRCKNLAHAFIHRRAPGEAQTFWAGLGAVRAEVFHRVGGFDERFTRPSVEDIDLGYRLRAAGYRILLEPRIEGRHLKRWTLRSAVVSDVRDRGVPWTQLLHRYGGFHDDLNLTRTDRVSVAAACLLMLGLMLAPRWPGLLVVVAVCSVAIWRLHRAYYAFLAQRCGVLFTAAWFPAHVLHLLCNALSFIIGNALYASRRWLGWVFPGALPLTPWTGGRTAAASEEGKRDRSAH